MKIKSFVTSSLIIVFLISALIIYLGIFADPKITDFLAVNWQKNKIKNDSVNITIENQTIVNIENTTSIKICTNSDWASTISPSTCPSTGKQIKKWQKLSNCSEGVLYPSNETISCKYVPPVTRAS